MGLLVLWTEEGSMGTNADIDGVEGSDSHKTPGITIFSKEY